MNWKRTAIASALMILTVIGLRFLTHGDEISPKKPLSTFPEQIGEWVGKEERFYARVYDILGVDDSILSSYQTSDGRQVQLYIGFYQSQREGDIIHSPKNCMPGSGWNITQTSIEKLNLSRANHGKIKVIKLVLEKGVQKSVVLYWFQSRGRIISSEYRQKIFLVWDAIFKHRTDGSFVRLIAPVLQSEAETTMYMKHFAQQLFPILEEYLPGSS